MCVGGGGGTKGRIHFKGGTCPWCPLVLPPMSNHARLLKVDEVPIFFLQSAPVCDAHLTFTDLDEGEIITIGDLNLTVAGNGVVFTSEQLKRNRLYNVTITASNINGSATSNTRISKYSGTSK